MSDLRLSAPAPLRGDGHGKYRVLIVGNSGSGKSTLGNELGSLLGVPFIPLDTLAWLPGWSHTTDEDFRSKVVAAMSRADNGWVVDGNYTKRLGSLVDDRATDIIWLDPPLTLYFPRLCWRTFLRLLRLAPPCSPGCEEDYRETFFSKDSILWWCLTNHWRLREREQAKFLLEGVHVGGRRRRIGGWGSELTAWIQSVRVMLRCE